MPDMKKITLWCLAVLAVIGGLIFLRQWRHAEIGADPVRLLPENTLLVAELKDVAHHLESFQQSHLGNSLAQIKYSDVARDVQLAPEHIQLIDTLQQKGRDFLQSPLYSILFSKDILLAVTPGDTLETQTLETIIWENCLFVATPKPGTKALQHFTPLLLDLTNPFLENPITVRTIPYGRYMIQRFMVDDDTSFSAAVVHDMIVLSLNERLLRHALSRYGANTQNLARAKTFQRSSHSRKDSHFFTYLSLENLCKLSPPLIKTSGREEGEPEDDPGCRRGLQGVGFGASHSPGFIAATTAVTFDEKHMHPAFAQLLATPPEKNRSFSAAPKETIFYHWTNTFDLPLIWQLYLEDGSISPEQEQRIRHEVQTITGTSIEKLLAMTDHKLSIIVHDVPTEGLIPLPNFSFLVPLKNQKTFAKALKKLLRAYDIDIKKQHYKGNELVFWGWDPKAGVQPVYVIYNNFLLVATNIHLIEKLIDTMDSKSGLHFDTLPTQADPGMTKANNSLAYLRVAPFLAGVKELLSWAGIMIAIQDREAAQKSKILIDQLITPIIDGFSAHSEVSTRSYNEKNRITYQSIIKVTQQPQSP